MASTLGSEWDPLLSKFEFEKNAMPRNRSFTSFNINNDLKMLEMRMCMEREREGYVRVVGLLSEQLRESQEHCKHLIDSHAELTRELETEADDGWREAKQWEERYNEIFDLVKSRGIEFQITHCTASIDVLRDNVDDNINENNTRIYSLSDDDRSDKIANFEKLNQFYKEDYDTFNTALNEITKNCSYYVESNHNDWVNLKSPVRFISHNKLDDESNKHALLLLSYADL